MPTFNNGESAASVRTKINDAIDKVDGASPITSVNIDGGTIDGVTIATSDITVGAGKTLNVSAGTLTLANDQISGDSVEGGTINAITINTLGSTTVNATTVDATNIEVANIKAKDGTASATIADSTGVMTIASSVLTTADINGGTIDGTVIGGSTPAAISGTTGTFSGNLTVDTNTLFVDAASNEVGIGTTSPRGALDINSGDPQKAYIADNTDGVTLGHSGADSFITLGSVGAGAVGVFNYTRSTGVLTYSEGAVGSEVEYFRIAGNGDISFYEDTGTTPKFFWDASAEALGIGTSSPVGRLTIKGVSGASALQQLAFEYHGTTSKFLALGLQDLTGNAQIMAGSGASLLFHTDSNLSTTNERMRIDTSGRVGIGTTDPSSGTSAYYDDLVIKNDTSGSGAGITIQSNTTNGFGAVEFRKADGTQVGKIYASSADGQLGFETGGSEKMRIDSSGNVGIGASSPGYNLEVQAASPTITARSTGANATRLLLSAENAAVYVGSTYSGSNIPTIFTQAGTSGGIERMRIDSSGNVLIGGTATPASATASLAIFNGTAPTGSVTNGVVLYAEDVSASSELKVRDEAGNVTTLSPHNFELIPEGPSEDMAWSYYSERDGKRINVDMLKAIRLLEQITGEKLVHMA